MNPTTSRIPSTITAPSISAKSAEPPSMFSLLRSLLHDESVLARLDDLDRRPALDPPAVRVGVEDLVLDHDLARRPEVGRGDPRPPEERHARGRGDRVAILGP